MLSKDFVKLLAQGRLPVQTSLAVYDEIAQLEQGVGFLETPEYRAVVDPREPAARAVSRERYLKLGWPAWFRVILPFAQRNVRAIHEAGGALVLASDCTFAPSALREFELGSIEAGKLADLVLLDADPTADIRNVRRVVRVWKGGVEIDRGALELPVNATSRPSATGRRAGSR